LNGLISIFLTALIFLVSQTDAQNNEIVFEHDLSNNREVITDRLGHSTIHEYDDFGNIRKFTRSQFGNHTR